LLQYYDYTSNTLYLISVAARTVRARRQRIQVAGEGSHGVGIPFPGVEKSKQHGVHRCIGCRRRCQDQEAKKEEEEEEQHHLPHRYRRRWQRWQHSQQQQQQQQ
jgi:hypothetical protein